MTYTQRKIQSYQYVARVFSHH